MSILIIGCKIWCFENVGIYKTIKRILSMQSPSEPKTKLQGLLTMDERRMIKKSECSIANPSTEVCRRSGQGTPTDGFSSGWPVLLGKKLKVVLSVGLLGTLIACGGGGGGEVSTPVPVTVLGVSNPRASEGGTAEGEAVLSFRVAVATEVTFPVIVGFTTSSTAIANPTSAVIGTSCSAGVNYYIPAAAGLTFTANTTNNTSTGSLTMSAGTSSRLFSLSICPRNSTSDKTIFLTWGGGGASGTATGTILGKANGDLTGSDRLNDTGIIACSNGATNGLSCPQASFPSQDAESGRDATPTITGLGPNRTTAFAFTSLAGGAVIQDNVTGLMWEGKTTGGGLHDVNSTFTWLNSAVATNGGAAGTASGGACTSVPAGCDTEKFIAAVNAVKLGGFSDWRLPTAQELSTLVDSGDATAPTIDASITNQFAGEYWTATPKAADTTGAWVVDFNSGAIASIAKSSARRARLVRGR